MNKYIGSEHHKNNARNAYEKGRIKLKELKDLRISEYNINPKYCKFCGKIFTYENRNKKYCNSSCSAKDTNKLKKGIKYKLSENGYLNIVNANKKIKNVITYLVIEENDKKIVIKKTKICPCCSGEFIIKRPEQKYCSKKCGAKNRFFSDETKDKLRNKVKERIDNGTFSGWSNRNIISYPEQFFIEVLNNNNITYIHNKPIKKKDLGCNENSNYFLDFYFEDKKIDLEIDGKQHKLKERKESDKKRDELLIKNGIKVYRIEWKSINNENGKIYIEKEIKKFLDYYNSN